VLVGSRADTILDASDVLVKYVLYDIDDGLSSK